MGPIGVKYLKVRDGEWIRPTKHIGHKICCCDCGLVHRFDFRIVSGRIEFRAIRDRRATAATVERRKIRRVLESVQSADAVVTGSRE